MRGQVDRLGRRVARVDDVGHVVNPLHDRRAGAELIAADGRSLVLLVDLSNGDLEDRGGIVAEDVAPLVDSSRLDVSMGGYAPSFNEVNDQTKKDLTKAELIAFPILALLLLLVFRGVIAASIPLLIGGISIVGTLFVLRVMSLFVDTSVFALNIATALSLGLAVDYALLMVSRYREEIGRAGASREAHRRTVDTAGRTALFSGLTVAARDGGAGDPAPALPLLDGRRRSLRRAALRGDRAARRPLACWPCSGRGSTRSRSAAARRSPTNPTAGTGWRAG